MMSLPRWSGATQTPILMYQVLLALLPGIIASTWIFGSSVLITLLLASVTALLAEAAMLYFRRRPVRLFLLDGSALITAWLLALSIPPLAPWWLVVVGTLIAIVIAKQLYGGLGYNLFNPAMVGYAALLISFPALMTQWAAPQELAKTVLNVGDQWHFMWSGLLPTGIHWDAISSATPLDYLKTQLKLGTGLVAIQQSPIYGHWGGKGIEIVAGAYLLGGLYLLQQRVTSWHVPVVFLGTLVAVSGIFHVWDAAHHQSPLFHLFTGGTMLGAFFIATDPVTGPTTPKGKWIFAAGIALLIWVIRVYGGYPDGIAFAVLLMNLCVPLIDSYTQPRVFGHKS